jgi:hypothetical protein
MSWISVAVGIGGALIGGIASNNAANTQADAANNATQAQLSMFNQTQQNLQPYMQAGQTSLADLMAGLNSGQFQQKAYTPFTSQQFQQDPGYQFQLQQGQNSLTNAASMSGGMNSNNLKGLMGYSQGLANQDYQTALQNYMQQYQLGNQATQQNFSNLAGLAGMGQNAAAGLGGISQNVGASIGSNMIGAGNAQAAGQVGVGNALSNGIGSAYNNYLQNQYMGSMATGNSYSPSIYGNQSVGGAADTSGISPSYLGSLGG